MEECKRKLTIQEKRNILDLIFVDDEEYYERIISSMTEEQFQKFLVECPEFLEEMENSQKENKFRKQKQ